MRMNSNSSRNHPIITFFKCVAAVCAGICLLIAIILYVYPTASVVTPIYNILMENIELTNYILCILIMGSIGARVVSFILSFFLKKEVSAENTQILDKLTQQQTTCVETTNQSISTLSGRIEKIEGRIEKTDRIVERNCNAIQRNLNSADKNISLFRVQGKRSLINAVKSKLQGTKDVSKKEIMEKLKETEKLLEKYQDEIRTQ